MVLKLLRSAYTGANPKPSDILLLVEISDTTLAFDRYVKAALYARAGIADYWVFDVAGRKIVVHRSPKNGAYADVREYEAGESVAPLAAQGNQLRAGDAFPG